MDAKTACWAVGYLLAWAAGGWVLGIVVAELLYAIFGPAPWAR